MLLIIISEKFNWHFFLVRKFMKPSGSTATKQSKQGLSHKPRPEIRDDIDSRQNKEIGYRGDEGKKKDRNSRK
jgi:hypothetical protein